MKHIYLYFLIVFNLFLINLTLESQPNIVWENYYKPDKLKVISSYSFFESDESYFLTYTGRSQYQFAENKGVIVTDKTGNLKTQYAIIDSFHVNINLIREHNNKFYNYETIVVRIFDDSGNFVEYLEDSTLSLWSFLKQGPIFHDNDLIYFGSDPTNRTIGKFLFKYNDKMQQTDSIKLDYSKIPDSNLIQKKYPPHAGIIANDNSIIIVDQGEYKKNLDNIIFNIVIKFDGDGNLIWYNRIEVDSCNKTELYSITQNNDGEYDIKGYAYNSDTYFYDAKLNSGGELLNYSLNPVRKYDNQIGVQRLQNNKKILYYGHQGYEPSPYWFLITDSTGDTLNFLLVENNSNNIIRFIKQLDNGNLLVMGRPKRGENFLDSIYFAEIGLPTSIYEGNTKYLFSMFPNPASEYIEIKLSESLELSESYHIKIYNTLGQCVIALEKGMRPVSTKRIDVSGLPVGMYFVRIDNYSKMFVKY